LWLQQQVLRLKKEKKTLIKKMEDMQHNYLGLTIEDLSVIREIKNATNDCHFWSCFMNDQFQNNAKKHENGFRWNQEVIKNCIILHARGPCSYEYLRKSGILSKSGSLTFSQEATVPTTNIGSPHANCGVLTRAR
jgi:hypothetical protein